MTVRFAFSVGLVVRRGERTFEFERRLNDNTLIFIDQLDKCPHQWPLGKVYRDIQDGKLHVVSGDHVPDKKDVDGLPLIFDINSLPDKHRDHIQRVHDYISSLRRMGLTRGMRGQIAHAIPKIAQRRAEKAPMAASTIMHWWRILEQNDNALSAVVNGHAFKQQPKRKPWAEPVARASLKNVYCTKQRRPLTDVVEDVNRTLEQHAIAKGLDRKALCISESTIRRYKADIEPYALDAARFGRSYANNRWRYSLKGLACTRAYERFEIDHTLLDVVVVCDRTGLPLGRPTITIVVDSYSSYVVGFFISFWGTGLSSTLSALKVAFGPKDEYQAKDLRVENPWLGMGICELLVMDNGLEFHSPQLHSVAMNLDMDLLYCKVRQPWLKPVVERSLGSAIRCLPPEGRVYKPVQNCLPLNPKQTASITFSALCQGLLKAFVDEHALGWSDTKLARPFDLFQDSLAALPPPSVPGPMDDLDIVVGASRIVTIGNEGALLDYLRFNSTDLQALRRRTAHRFTTEIRFNPGNLGQIYVRVPDTASWLPVACCFAEYSEGLSLVQHKAIRQLSKDELNRKNAEESLTRMKRELRDFWSSQVRVGKSLKSKHIQAMGELTSAHSLRASAVATDTRPAQPTRALNIVCDTDLAPAPMEIPVFETIQRV